MTTEVGLQIIEVTATPAPVVVEVVVPGPQGPAGTSTDLTPRSITIAGPLAGDSFTLFRTTVETTVESMTAVVSGGSVAYEIRYASDRSTAGTLAASDTVTNTTTGDSATLQNQPIPAGCYVWVQVTAVTGTVNEFNLSIGF